ncbi:unnamed protein product [Heterotrigona itama]|uniref:Uncharacterized protein n=1 Tax=Heterotrigona itama TaxID=395501 RepID=A0A6V7HIC8_9HYME|nr:unnamed protein product [Heterotrigona itama]
MPGSSSQEDRHGWKAAGRMRVKAPDKRPLQCFVGNGQEQALLQMRSRRTRREDNCNAAIRLQCPLCADVANRMTIDEQMTFEENFATLLQRVERVAVMLRQILPSIGGAVYRVRKHYTSVIRSMALYCAPVWSRGLTAKHDIARLLRRLQ